MRRTRRLTRSARNAAGALTVLALGATAACGSAGTPSSAGTSSSTPTAAASPSADTSLGQGDWLLGMNTAGGADGEESTATYITYNPSTGVASAHKLPGYKAPSADPDDAPLLVSADRRWAIPDTGISRSEENSGRLKVYSLTGAAAKVIDIRSATGDAGLHALGWAFDPQQAGMLRVVDSKSRVWTVSVTGGRATRAGSLTKGPWVFTNGFNHNTGQPYVESIESDATKPAGNGATDTTAVTRANGTVLANDSDALAKLPKSPCRLAGGFTDAQGTTWEFCADSSTIKTYYLAKGAQQWTAYGKPSSAVAPVAAGFPLVLPPAK